MLDKYKDKIEEEIRKIKSEDSGSIIFATDGEYYLHMKSDIKYPLSNSKLLYDNLLFHIIINNKLSYVDGIESPIFISSKDERALVKDVRGVEAQVFIMTGSIFELSEESIIMDNLKYLYKYFIEMGISEGMVYSILISKDFSKIYEYIKTLPTKYILLSEK